MKKIPFVVSILLMVTLIIACTVADPGGITPQPTDTLTMQTEIPAETITPPPEVVPTITSDPVLRIRLKTTSDWTELGLDYFASWAWRDVISASTEASLAEITGNHLVLNQAVERAEAGDAVEMTVDLLLPDWDAGGVIIFNLTRGNLGFSGVQISRPVDGAWAVIKTFTWDEVALDDLNTYVIEYSVDDLFSATSIPGQLLGDSDSGFATGMLLGTEGYSWWHDSVFYEISVRSFYDSDGDGIGDFNGLTQKLDYLNDGDPETTSDLGVTGIWLRPINSCNSTHGYDITDYYGLNPEFGTLEDFKTFLTESHARGIHVIIDLVLNHSGVQNPWFVEGVDPASPTHDWFIWSGTDPGYAGSWGQRVWFLLEDVYYYSTFASIQPDLNYMNTAVTEEMYNVVRYWLEDVGVDGFRFDAAKHLIEDGIVQSNTLATHDWYKAFHPVYKAANPHALVIGELWEQADVQADYLQGDEIDLAFDFFQGFTIIPAVNAGDAGMLYDQVMFSYSRQPALGVAPILTNFDLDRLMSRFKSNQGKAKVAATLMLAVPGVPFIYYGEEIGMQGEIVGMGYDDVRRPMQWSTENNAGFTTGNPWLEIGEDWEIFNVANEYDLSTSILSHYRSLIQARNQHSALRGGDLSLVATENKGLYSILRVSQEEAVLVLVNLTGQPVTDYGLSLISSLLTEGTYTPTSIIGEGPFAPLIADPEGGFSGYVPVDWLPAYRSFILQFDME